MFLTTQGILLAVDVDRVAAVAFEETVEAAQAAMTIALFAERFFIFLDENGFVCTTERLGCNYNFSSLDDDQIYRARFLSNAL